MSTSLANHLLDAMKRSLAHAGAPATDSEVARTIGVDRRHLSRARRDGVSVKLARKWSTAFHNAGHPKVVFQVGMDETQARAWSQTVVTPRTRRFGYAYGHKSEALHCTQVGSLKALEEAAAIARREWSSRPGSNWHEALYYDGRRVDISRQEIPAWCARLREDRQETISFIDDEA